MDDKSLNKLEEFDSLFASDRIKLLKILSGYSPRGLSRPLIIYIKYLELKHSMHLPTESIRMTDQVANIDLSEILSQIEPLCHSDNNSSILQLLQTLQTIKEWQDTLEMMQSMKDFSYEGVFETMGNMENMKI